MVKQAPSSVREDVCPTVKKSLWNVVINHMRTSTWCGSSIPLPQLNVESIYSWTATNDLSITATEMLETQKQLNSEPEDDTLILTDCGPSKVSVR